MIGHTSLILSQLSSVALPLTAILVIGNTLTIHNTYATFANHRDDTDAHKACGHAFRRAAYYYYYLCHESYFVLSIIISIIIIIISMYYSYYYYYDYYYDYY